MTETHEKKAPAAMVRIECASVKRALGDDGAEVDTGGRFLDVVASTADIDSFGEVVVQDWDLTRYVKNPVVLYGHDSWSLDAVIGRAENVRVEDGQLKARIVFATAEANPKAEQVWQLVKQDMLRAVSVGFKPKSAIPGKLDERDVVFLAGNELLEISVVPIGANASAVAVAKSFEIIRSLMAGPSADTVGEDEKNMKTIAKSLGLKEDASEVEIVSELQFRSMSVKALLDAAGVKSLDELQGVVMAGKAAAAKVTELTAKITEQGAAIEKRERGDLIAAAQKKGQLAPTLLTWASECPIDALKTFVASAPAIPQFVNQVQEPDATTVTLKHNGKSWDEMGSMEKHNLFFENRSLYDAMKADAARRAEH